MSASLVQVRSLTKHFRLPGGWLSGRASYVYAVDGVDLEIAPGEVFGLVGESGCGKTTLGRILLRLIDPTAGQVLFEGRDLFRLKGDELRAMRQQMQVVFQNPLSSLSPRFKVEQIVAEPLITHHILPRNKIRGRVIELLEQAGLGKQHLDRFPHELSGGQCQRVAVARALSVNPKLIVLDEPTSALDVSVQAQIINLLEDLKKSLGLTYLFISHDLSVVQHISDRIGVMYLGRLVELAEAKDLFARPRHPYTRMLLDAVPDLEMSGRPRTPVAGEVPNPLSPPAGCAFHPRCPHANERCRKERPRLMRLGDSACACHAAEENRI